MTEDTQRPECPGQEQTEYGTLHLGDVRDCLRALPDNSVHCVVTSPPYWGLRDYGLPPSVWGDDPDCEHEWGEALPGIRRDNQHLDVAVGNKSGGRKHSGANLGIGTKGCYCQRCGAWRGCLGAEPTMAEYVQHMVEVIREVWRVLRPDGTLWLNLGDGYFGDSPVRKTAAESFSGEWDPSQTRSRGGQRRSAKRQGSLKAKDLLGIPWRIAFALQEDGWFLRADIVWHKPNPKPESVTDRPTACHEYVFLLSKEPRYYYDGHAVRERAVMKPQNRNTDGRGKKDAGYRDDQKCPGMTNPTSRNHRDVWTIPTRGYKGAHFATYPEALVTPCILAGTSAGGCCPHCGKPWERLVRKEYKRHEKWFGDKQQVRHSRGEAGQAYNELIAALTIGFRPACDCGKQSPCPVCNGAGRKLANPLAAINAARKRAAETGKPCKPTRRWSPCRACLGAGFPRVEWPGPVPCVVLDPFMGSGTTAAVSVQHGRHWVGIELNPDYAAMAIERITSTQSRLLHECA